MDSPIPVDLGRIAQDLQIRRLQVESVVQLLDEGNTVPFITRYRKERTGNLEETAIREIQRRVARLRELAERKQTVLRSIEAQGRLTEELAEAIKRADTPQRLEDLYLPFKPKKRTKAGDAREKGLEPLALRIWNRDETLTDLRGAAEAHVDPSKGVDSVDQVIEGVGHILAESISELANVRDAVRRVVWRLGRVVTRKADNLPEGQGMKYADYFEYSEPVGQVPPHRVLAINRGDKEGPLKVKIEVPREDLERTIRSQLPLEDHPQSEAFTNAAIDALDRLLMPSLEREVRRELTERAEQHAVEVFARNLRSLLLQPPIPKQTVLALDPGFRTGCKVVVLDPLGTVKEHGVIFLMPAHRRAEGKRYLKDLVARHEVEVIAIGNGTASRETEELIVEILEEGTRFHEMALRGEEFVPPPPDVQDLPPLQAPETFGSGLVEQKTSSDATASEAAPAPETTEANPAAEAPSSESTTPEPASAAELPAEERPAAPIAGEVPEVPEPTAPGPDPQQPHPAQQEAGTDVPTEPQASSGPEEASDSDSNGEAKPHSGDPTTEAIPPVRGGAPTEDEQRPEPDPKNPPPSGSDRELPAESDPGSDGKDRPDAERHAEQPGQAGTDRVPPVKGGAPSTDDEQQRPEPDPQSPPPSGPNPDLPAEPEPSASAGDQGAPHTVEHDLEQSDQAANDRVPPPDGADAPKTFSHFPAAELHGSAPEASPADPTTEPEALDPVGAMTEAPVGSATEPTDPPAPDSTEPAAEGTPDQPAFDHVPAPEAEVAQAERGGGEIESAPLAAEAPDPSATPSAESPEGQPVEGQPAEGAAASAVVDLTKPPVGSTSKPKGQQQPSGKKQRDRDQRPKPKGPPPPPMPHAADPILARLSYVIVNEAGASVYSASPVGKEEFPNYDATTRGTVSIGRRLQDPLAELVKIEPQNIGVGLYQHDVGTKQLKESLESVIESCVNYVGVDLNSASIPLLRHVSGLNSLTARRLVEFRQQNGSFSRRDQILQIEGIGEATFTQAAGFLKILEGENPLDRTWVHPENYAAAEKILARLGFDLPSLLDKERLATLQANLLELRDKPEEFAALAQELELGEPTLADILDALARPGRDPREDLPKPVFKKGFLKLEDLQPGMELRGTVLNVVDFGAFVDIGLKDSGLVHISQLANRYVKSPHDVVSVGDVVTVWVLSVDQDRKKVSLTMVPPGTERPKGRGHGEGAEGEGQGRPPRGRGRGRGPGRPHEGQAPATEGGASSDAGAGERRPGTGRIPGPPLRAQQGQRGRGGPGGGRGGPGGGGRGYGRGGPGGGRGGPGGGRPDQGSPPPPRPTTPRKPAGPPEPLSQDAIKGSVPLRSFGQLAQLWKARVEDEPSEQGGGEAPSPNPAAPGESASAPEQGSAPGQGQAPAQGTTPESSAGTEEPRPSE